MIWNKERRGGGADVPKCDLEPRTKFLEFSHNTVGYTRYTYLVISTYALKNEIETEDAHFAYRQSIMPLTSSSLFCSEKLMKLVSIRTR